MTHKTKGIVLRSIKYGETSIITSVYTELFGLQNYIVKGVRQTTKRSQNRTNYFQPGAILELEAYHNELKNLQFIKEFQWSYLYENVFYSVVKNAVAMFIVELLQHTIKQPETNHELYYLSEGSLKRLDYDNDRITANLPLYFILHLGNKLGFQIRGGYSAQRFILDLKEGIFTSEIPQHLYYISNEPAQYTARINSMQSCDELEDLHLNRFMRRELLQAYLQFIALHAEGFSELKSVNVLQEVLG